MKTHIMIIESSEGLIATEIPAETIQEAFEKVDNGAIGIPIWADSKDGKDFT